MSAGRASQIERRIKVERVYRQRAPNYPWTDERTKFAVERSRAGISASAIRDELAAKWPADGKPTRNAVIGKIHRATAGSPHRNQFTIVNSKPRPVSQRVQKINNATASEMDRAPPTSVNLQAIPVSDIQTLQDPSRAEVRKLGPLANPATGGPHSVASVNRGMCHYPIGDPMKPGFGYCGRTAFVRERLRFGDDGVTPYCAAHRLLVYDPKEDNKRNRELKKISRSLPKNLRS